MNKKTFLILGISIVAASLVVGYQLFVAYKATQQVDPTQRETVMNRDVGLSFSYPSGPSGFTLVEPDAAQKGMLKAHLLFPSEEYDSYKNSDEAREAPAGMNIFVFALPESVTATTTEQESRITRLQNWAADNATLTSFNQAKNTPDIVELDGVKALHYQADGLYQQDIYLASYKSKVYMFVGQYNDVTDQTYTAFQDLIQTVVFE